MSALTAFALTVTAPLASPSPTPSPTYSENPLGDLTPAEQAAPGVWAFVAFLFLVVSLWMLMRNMNSRLRRMSYAARAESAQRSPERGDSGAGAGVERDRGGDVVGHKGQDR